MDLSPMNEADKFWSRVEKTETCWLWKGAISKHILLLAWI